MLRESSDTRETAFNDAMNNDRDLYGHFGMQWKQGRGTWRDALAVGEALQYAYQRFGSSLKDQSK